MSHELYIGAEKNMYCRRCGEVGNDLSDFSDQCFYPKIVCLIGEHSKGGATPFSDEYLSGKRLKSLIKDAGLICELDNAFSYPPKSTKDLSYLINSDLVVALGRSAEKELIRQGIDCLYLPHPACRSKAQLEALRQGLEAIANDQKLTRRM